MIVRNVGPQHRGMRIHYNRILDGTLADIEPHQEYTGIILAQYPGFRWLVPSCDDITIWQAR